MNESNERKKGAILSYVSIAVGTLIQLLYTPLLIRMLGQSEYGLYSLVNSIIGYLTVLDLGFGNAIVVFTAKYRAQKKFDEERKLHGMFFVVFCIIGLIVALIGLVLFFNIDNIFSATMTSKELHKTKIMMLILIFNLIVSFVFNIYSSILNAYEKFVFQKVVSILNSLIKPIIMIPLLFLGYKSITLVVVITIVNIIVLFSNYIYCRKKLNVRVKYQGFDKKIFKSIIAYSFWIFLGTIVDKVNWSVDNFILGAVVGTTAVSIYSVAASLNTLFKNLSTAISNVLLPKMTKMIAKNASSNDITNEFIKVGRIQYYIIFLMCTGLIMFGKEFIIAWVGKKYIESYYVALVLIIPICFPLIQNLGLSIMQAMNKYKFKSVSTFIMAIFNVFISIFLSKKYGPLGAAMGTALALILCNIILINIYYYKVIKINVIKFWKSIAKMTIPFFIPIVIVLLLSNLFEITGVKFILVYGSIYTILYCNVAYFIVMNDYEKNIIHKFVKNILKLLKRRNKHETN